MKNNEKKIIRLQTAMEVLNGNLFIEEAMLICEVFDKRTMIKWIKIAMSSQKNEVNDSIHKNFKCEDSQDQFIEIKHI